MRYNSVWTLDAWTVVHCCTLSLCWDWVQGGNPLYAAVKCLSVSRGQIWQIFFIFFAKSTWHIHFLTSLFFLGRAQIFFPPQNWLFFWVPPLFQNWGPIPKIEGPGCERILGSAAVVDNTSSYSMFWLMILILLIEPMIFHASFF